MIADRKINVDEFSSFLELRDAAPPPSPLFISTNLNGRVVKAVKNKFSIIPLLSLSQCDGKHSQMIETQRAAKLVVNMFSYVLETQPQKTMKEILDFLELNIFPVLDSDVKKAYKEIQVRCFPSLNTEDVETSVEREYARNQLEKELNLYRRFTFDPKSIPLLTNLTIEEVD